MINNKIEISINKKENLVIGQSVNFTVALSSEQPYTNSGLSYFMASISNYDQVSLGNTGN